MLIANIFFMLFIKTMTKLTLNKIPTYLRPAKRQQVPKFLIYSKRDVRMFDVARRETVVVDIHKMADMENKLYAGEMITRTLKNYTCDEIYPEEKSIDVLKIELLNIAQRRKGYGKEFLKFAQTESKKQGCNGKVFLVASRIYDPNNPCHIFYRKQGYTSTDSYINYMLDRSIRNHSKLSYEYADNLLMYKPINSKQSNKTKQGFIEKLKKFIGLSD